MSENVEVAVVGGGQAGLAAGYYLALQGLRFVILDRGSRVGDSWRNRWDSLTLFSSAAFDSLPGLSFPGDPDRYPTRDEVGDYLEAYARRFELPVRLDSPVQSVKPDTEGFVLETGTGTVRAEQVVIATGAFQKPYVPAISRELPSEVFQIHTSEYRNPQQLPPGEALVIGAGDSGVQIAQELAKSRKVYLSIGSRHQQLPQRLLGWDIFWWLYRLGVMNVTIETPLGQRLRGRATLIGTGPDKLAREHGVILVGRTERVQEGRVRFAGGQSAQVRSVVWATGYRPDFSWIQAPVFDKGGAPVHKRGVTATPGLYFLGLLWQYRRDSALLGGVGRDAEYLAGLIARTGRRSLPGPGGAGQGRATGTANGLASGP